MKPVKAPPKSGGTNWILIGGIVGVGAILLIALLLYSTTSGGGSINPRDAATQTAESRLSLGELGQQLATYCEDNPQRCFAKGSETAPVTIFEFSDYGCGHCRDFNLDGGADTIDTQYVKAGQVRWVNVPFALRSETLPAAASAMCAGEQGKLFEYHKVLFSQQTEAQGLAREGFVKAATTVGLDLNAFERCLDANKHVADVNGNMTLANQAGLEGTPTFFVNGQKLAGNNLAGLQQLINAELAQ